MIVFNLFPSDVFLVVWDGEVGKAQQGETLWLQRGTTGWEPGAFSFSIEKEFALAYGTADFQVRELFPSTSSLWSSRDAMEKRENPTCHFGLSSVISALCRARVSRSILAVQLEF